MLRLVAVVIAGLALGLLATAVYACNDSAYNAPPPQVQVPPPDSQT